MNGITAPKVEYKVSCHMSGIPESVRVKIERANQHIADLDAAIARFWENRPYRVVGFVDSQGRPTYQIAHIQPIDPRISAIAGDAVQNLRTALDFMACALWRRANVGDCKIYFPIAGDIAKYQSEALKKAKGIGQDAIQAISAVEPYQGGKGDTLWRLHCLSVIDKHRLPLTVAGANLGIHLPSIYPEMFPDSAKSNPWILSVGEMRCPLKDNDILFRDDPGREVKKDLQLPFFVALDEPSIFHCQPLLPTLKTFAGSVRDVVTSLALLL